MCGRFALGIPRRLIRERFGLEAVPDAPPRFNIAPGQLVEAVLAAGPQYLADAAPKTAPVKAAAQARDRLVANLAGHMGELFGDAPGHAGASWAGGASATESENRPDTGESSSAPAGSPGIMAEPGMPVGSAAVPRIMGLFRWGLIPSWARDPSMGARMVNARAETAWEKPAFRSAMRRRRCLVPAQGFYEWSGSPGRRQPWFISPGDGSVMALAGIWERYESPAGEVVDSLAVLTCAANDLVAPLHDRMPVLVEPGDDARWLDPMNEASSALADILAPREWRGFSVRMVGPRVNSARNEGPELLDAWPPLGG